MIEIEMKNIKKTFGKGEAEVTALKGISLKVKQGEMVAIVGTSGSGKTTLLNIIGCIESPTEGTYFLNSQSIDEYKMNELAKIRNSLFGFVRQDFALIEHYNVKDNILLPLKYQKDKEIKQKNLREFSALIRRLGLEAKMNSRVALLSGGQKQRVAIGRALINNPNIILADEPTGSLDKKNSEEILNLLTELNKEGKTVIIITHDLEVANRCERIITIDDGAIQE